MSTPVCVLHCLARRFLYVTSLLGILFVFLFGIDGFLAHVGDGACLLGSACAACRSRQAVVRRALLRDGLALRALRPVRLQTLWLGWCFASACATGIDQSMGTRQPNC